MAEEQEEEDKNKRIRPRERAAVKKKLSKYGIPKSRGFTQSGDIHIQIQKGGILTNSKVSRRARPDWTYEFSDQTGLLNLPDRFCQTVINPDLYF